MNFPVYAAKVVLCSAILLGYYQLFLRNRKFHGYNRFYVLASAAFSALFPLLRIPVFNQGDPASAAWLNPLQAISLSGWEEAFTVTARSRHTSFPDWPAVAWILYAGGLILCSIPVIRSLLHIRKLTRRYKKDMMNGIAFYHTEEPDTPFSFLLSVFWNSRIPLNSEKGRCMLQHELYHIRAKHSYDVLLLQLLTILFWFNPFFRLFLRELQTIHEFLADEQAGLAANRYDYAELLVTQAIERKNNAVSQHFFQYQIKRRIAMIIKQQPSRISYLSRVMTLPLVAVVFGAFTFQSCRQDTINGGTGPARSAATPAQQQTNTGLIPAAEFMAEWQKHLSKETSVTLWSDTSLNLMTAKFENGKIIMTRLSEFKEFTRKEPDGRPNNSEPVTTKVDDEADYPGGAPAYRQFLLKTVRYPMEAQKLDVQGTVVVQFMVDKTGNISDVRAISGPEQGGLREEAVRVINASGKWMPAVQNGHAVSSYKKQPIIFRMDPA